MNPEPRALPGDDLRPREGPAVSGGSHQGVYGSDRGAQGPTGLWGEERGNGANTELPVLEPARPPPPASSMLSMEAPDC